MKPQLKKLVEAKSLEENQWTAIIDSFRKMISNTKKNLVKKTGYSIAEFRILSMLDENSCSMTTLSTNLGLTQAAITGIVDKLESLSLVKRVRSNEDRRIIMININEKGEKELRRAQRLHREFIELALGTLGATEIEEFSRILKKLADETAKLSS